MLARLGDLVQQRPRTVLALAALFVVASGALGGSVADRLSSAGFDDPASEQYRAAAALDREFGEGEPRFLLLVHAAGSVDDPAVRDQGVRLTEELAREEGVVSASSYWTLGGPPSLRSEDGGEALVFARFAGSADAALDTAKRLAQEYRGERGLLRVEPAGQLAVAAEVGDRIRSDLTKAELIIFPVTFVLLVLVFGGVVAALLPLAVGALAMVGTLLVLRLLTSFTDVSIYAMNLATGLGLGLAIDYSLFVLSRYREEVHAGRDRRAALRVTVRTAGRTVVFSALTVALSLSALLVFPLFFLRSFAYAGVAVVLLAAAGAVIVLPALLAVLGPRVDALRVLRRDASSPAGEGFWHRTALVVMRRPVVTGGTVLVLLVVLGSPFLRAEFALPDDRVLPRDAATHRAVEQIREEFPARETQTLFVVAPDAPAAASADTAGYATKLSRVDGVARVDSAAGSFTDGALVAPPPAAAAARFAPQDGSGTWLSVVPTVEAYSDAGRRLVRDVRAVQAPYDVVVGGPAARLVDTSGSLADRLPLALALIAAATLLLLFLFTGSVVLPIKAVALNLLSLTAAFGAMVWVFQEGHLAWLVGDPIITGAIDLTTPILLFCVAFGLSMDYEVFLLSRIKEEWNATGDNVLSVARGLARTGRIVTAAAALMAVVFLAMATGGVTFVKLFGLGMALAVLVDATLVRGVLVPAFMRLAGRANWWAPDPLRRLHDRIGLAEHAPPAPVPAQRPDHEDVSRAPA